MKSITSRDNPAVKHLHGLAHNARDRRKAGETLFDGPHLIGAALDAGWPLKRLVVSESGYARAEIRSLLERAPATIPALKLDDSLVAHVSPVDTPTGILAVADIPPAAPAPAAGASLVVLDGVQDPGNLGTILRTAAAAGVEDVVLTGGCAQPWSPRTLRAGMGAHFHLRIHECTDLAGLLAAYPGAVLATALDARAKSLYETDLRGPVAWLFGAEGQGLSEAAKVLATGTVLIPMAAGIESLNVAAAAAVCLFEQRRQRAARG